ncbi:unnamed protein product [Caenorhabditis angaria]|uniref:Trehalase n=1 Tax=Caenorhabditis angaria TaxID=860376 RepID=A0A9P1IVN7_9PELO|nr:unnamed protein product [Caenorhabditis angaria]
MIPIFVLFLIYSTAFCARVPVCDSTNSNNSFIYCEGPILEAVNYHQLYNDSKTFVDMPMKQNPQDVLNAFNLKFQNSTAPEKINKTDLQTFIDQYFSAAGTELIQCVPDDWKEKPEKLATIKDPQLREWAYKLNGIWKQLCRKIDPSIEQHNSRYSLLYVPHHFIIPGGRFREFYYWDAYWIVKGLIASEMYNTTRSMIRNLATMVNTHGFVPNGGRVYYLQRSQPPFLSAMVYELYEATNDKDFIAELLPTLKKELDFWDQNRMINVTMDNKTYKLYQYKTASNVPRPESYRVDTENSAKFGNDTARQQQFYQDIASAAESGWDFSTRWFSDHLTISTIETTNVIPVDLNGLVCWNMDILEYLYEQVGDMDNSETFRSRRADFRNSVHNVFYNKTDGTFYDYNVRSKSHNANFYTSTAVPLFTNCYNTMNTGIVQKTFDYMDRMGAFTYPSGIPTSMIQNSEEQWDFPNGWSPNNHMIIEGLRKSANPEMQDQGFEIASKWVLGNFKVFYETGHMWEKYNVIGSYPQPGSGGEYDVQDGFGWTNGAILDLLLTYNDRLFVPDNFINTTSTSTTSTTTSSSVQTTTSSTTKTVASFSVLLFTLLVWIFV